MTVMSEVLPSKPPLFALVFEIYSIMRSKTEHVSERVRRINPTTDKFFCSDHRRSGPDRDTVEQMFEFLDMRDYIRPHERPQ